MFFAAAAAKIVVVVAIFGGCLWARLKWPLQCYDSLANPSEMAQLAMGVHNRQQGPHDSILGRLDDFIAGMLACELLLLWSASPNAEWWRARIACPAGLLLVTAGCLCLNMTQLAVLPYWVSSLANPFFAAGNALLLIGLARRKPQQAPGAPKGPKGATGCVSGGALGGVLAAPPCPVQRVFSFPPLVHLGQLQYAIYLLHGVFLTRSIAPATNGEGTSGGGAERRGESTVSV